MARVWLVLGIVLVVPAQAALRTVLAEEFTGTWCPWCPSAMQGLYNLEQQVGNRVAVVAYHVNDPFQVPGCLDRRTYYNITGYPTVMFDGVIRVVGGAPEPVNYQPYYNQRQGIPSPVTMVLALLSYDGASGQGTVRAEIYNEPENPTLSAALRYVAVGDDTLYSWQGFDHLYYTALHIFPSAQGVPLVLEPGVVTVDVQPFQLPPGWRDRACTIVAFLQDDTTREVLQAARLGEVTPVELLSFMACVEPRGVRLEWTTASERDNAGFLVRRDDGSGPRLVTPCLIPGAGTSAVPHSYEWVDERVSPGTYVYSLTHVSLDGTEEVCASTSVRVEPLPRTYAVQVLPCPAVDKATLTWWTGAPGRATVTVRDLSGRLVRRLWEGVVPVGVATSEWDLRDQWGTPVPPGLYSVTVRTGQEELRGVVVVVR